MEVIRKWAQVVFGFMMNGYLMFPFTRNIYHGPLKVICAPGLNCYSCPASTTFCPLGALQQLLAGVRLAVSNGQHYFGLYVMGCMGLLAASVGRFICGWACPFGFLQELIHKIPSRKFGIPAWLKYPKYFFLLFFVILLPLFAVDEFGFGEPWFCKYVCPAGTFEAGIPMLILQPDLRSTIGLLFYNKLAIMIGFLAWCVPVSRPFCRTSCPLGAFYALFKKIKFVKLRHDPQCCTQCEACHKVCPMGVKFNENPDDPECISCLACMSQACHFDAIYLEVGGLPIAQRHLIREPRFKVRHGSKTREILKGD